jgi:hypothetical protein
MYRSQPLIVSYLNNEFMHTDIELAGQYATFMGAIEIKKFIDKAAKTCRMTRSLQTKIECIFEMCDDPQV